MNGSFFENPTFPGDTQMPSQIPNAPINPSGNKDATFTLPSEQKNIEHILRLNKGKKINAYVSFPNTTEWKNKIYTGIIEEAIQDHLIISDPNNGQWFLIRMIYLDYMEFDEPIKYTNW